MTWRCFHCGEVFRREVDARAHFGDWPEALAGCQIKGHEGRLLGVIRAQERELRQYRTEDGEIMRAMEELRSESAAALKLEEEKGYVQAVRDMQELALKQFGRKVDV